MARVVILVTLIIAGVTASGARSQDYGRPQQGRAIAQERCAPCHAIDRGQKLSPRHDAAPFPAIAATPGMTETALLASLQTSHREMPNLILGDDEKRDIIAYILSLRRRN